MWLSRLFRAGRPASRLHEVRPEDTELVMACALTFGLRARAVRLQFLEHCARVTALVDALVDEMGVEGPERTDLRTAAQLHEIGMIAVPAPPGEDPVPLDPGELARLRERARVGAEIVRATHSARTALLIEHQHSDFAELRTVLPPDGRDLLLAGILRVADVFDAMTHPLPHQRSPSAWERRRILRTGQGRSFHPEAVQTILRLEPIRLHLGSES